MNRIDFYRLPRAVQDSLIDSMSGQFSPTPLLVRFGPRRTALAHGAAALGAGLALAALAGAGYGDAASALAVPPRWVALVYALL
ncbi:MAG TPA: hypothetical protein VHB21_21895, partial [Minicystis sp.]|nr:hypothetical protein [Minicystis sp.]